MDKCSCVKSLCDGYDVESDTYREFKRERKACLQDDKLHKKNIYILIRKRGVSHQSKKQYQFKKSEGTSKHTKQSTLQEMFQNTSKQVLKPEPQPSTSGTCASVLTKCFL